MRNIRKKVPCYNSLMYGLPMLSTQQTQEVFRRLSSRYPHPKAPLKHTSAYELLVAVILSAQCTDERVNMVTPALFKKANTPEKIMKLGENGIKPYIRSCGFYNAKAKSIYHMSKSLLEKFHGEVPGTLEELMTLRGVAEKSASVILCQWFKIPAFPVDTHVFRVTNRLGMVKANTPQKTYQALTKKVPKKYWIDGSLQLVFHGRYTCLARKPKCARCVLQKICQYTYKNL